jgi:hypothetical protein
MNETSTPSEKRKAMALRKSGLLIFLVVSLIAIGAAVMIFNMGPAGQPINVGLAARPFGVLRFCAYGDEDTHYVFVRDGRIQSVTAALKGGRMTARCCQRAVLEEFNQDEYAVIAITSYMNLVAVENGGTVASIFDLKDHRIDIPSSIQNQPEMRMLNLLLTEANLSPNLVFESAESLWQRVQNADFDMMILPVERCASVLLYSDRYRVCFDLAKQWNTLVGSQPPAGGCIIMRNTVRKEKQDAINVFLAAAKASIGLIDAHRKKASLLIAADGLGDDSLYIWKTIPHCMFAYLDGESMNDPLEQLSMLTATQR